MTPILRTILGLILLAATVVPSAWAQAKQGTPFGALFNTAHDTDGIITFEDVVRGLLQTATFGSHIAVMHEWQTPGSMRDLTALAPAFRTLGLKVFLQFAPTALGEPTADGVPVSFADPAVRARYLGDVVQLALLQPEYLNLCAEVDLTFLLSPANAVPYASLYKEAYDLVKQISPQTQVGVSYHMDAFFAAELFWLPDYLGPQDFIGFTTYPGWMVHAGVVPRVADFPAAFYDRIRLVFPDKPIVFAEVGWPSDGPGTRQEQADFIRALPRLMANVGPDLVTWTTLTDTHYYRLSLLSEAQRASLEALDVDPQELFDQLNSMGLFDWDGIEKPAYDAALELEF